jgi:hypothetical protein
MGYESFLMDIGMYGNPFDLNYTRFSFLATAGTWFKNLWELLTDFDVTATLSNECHLHPAHLGNLLLMFEFSKHFSSPDLLALNVVCQHKKVIYLSCIDYGTVTRSTRTVSRLVRATLTTTDSPCNAPPAPTIYCGPLQ